MLKHTWTAMLLEPQQTYGQGASGGQKSNLLCEGSIHIFLPDGSQR